MARVVLVVSWLVFVPAPVLGDTLMSIDKTYQLPFPPEVVYAAWVSSDTVIPPATAMDIDPKEGGHYRLIMETPEFTGRNEGTFTLVEPNQRVTYTWEWNGDGEVTTIDVVFQAKDQGTHLMLKHTGFSKRESMESHDAGWDSYIAGLTSFLHERSAQ
ncbi:MAG: SRPBCC domain-containing protein [Pseudomonadota bacterium]